MCRLHALFVSVTVSQDERRALTAGVASWAVLLSNAARGDARDVESTRGGEGLDARMVATGKVEEARGRKDDEKEVDDAEPFFERSDYGKMHLKASPYFTEPESGTSRAWDKFRKQLQAEYHIQSEPSAAATRAFHFRLPGYPLDDGSFVEANKSWGHNSGPSSNGTSSNSNISYGVGGSSSNARRAYSANASIRRTSPRSVSPCARSVSPCDTSASLIRDGERREQVETVDTEGQVVSGTSRAWKVFLARVRAEARANNPQETGLRCSCVCVCVCVYTYVYVRMQACMYVCV